MPIFSSPARPPFGDARPPYEDSRPGRQPPQRGPPPPHPGDRRPPYPREDRPPFGQPPVRPPFREEERHDQRPPYGMPPWKQEGKDHHEYRSEHRGPPPPFDDRASRQYGEQRGRPPQYGEERGRDPGFNPRESRFDEMRGHPPEPRGPHHHDIERSSSRSSHEYDNQGHSEHQPNVQDVLSKVMQAAKAGEIPGVTLPHDEGGH